MASTPAPPQPGLPTAPPLDARDQERFDTAFAEGRRHLAVSEPALAIAPLRRAVALRPTDGDLRCQLALAAFLVGDFGDARAEIDLALSWLDPAPESELVGVPTAMCALIAGRIEEQAPSPDPSLALRRYEHALAVEPTDEARDARQRLHDRGWTPAVSILAASSVAAGANLSVPADADDGATEEIARGAFCDCFRGSLGDAAAECPPASTLVLTSTPASGVGASPAFSARTIDVSPTPASTTCRYLVLRAGRATRLMWLGAWDGVYGVRATQLVLADLAPGGSLEASLRVEHTAREAARCATSDHAPAACESYDYDRSWLVVCGDDGGLRCVRLPIAETIAHRDRDGRETDSIAWRVEPTFASGALSLIASAPVPPGSPVARFYGVHLAASLLAARELDWPLAMAASP